MADLKKTTITIQTEESSGSIANKTWLLESYMNEEAENMNTANLFGGEEEFNSAKDKWNCMNEMLTILNDIHSAFPR